MAVKAAMNEKSTNNFGSSKKMLRNVPKKATLVPMNAKDQAHELMQVLDYILNRCTLREMDALQAAVERRRKDLESSTGIISLDPERAARQMSGAVENSINQSMESIRKTFREFAVDLIRKEAPELSDEQMKDLVDSWLPEASSLTRPDSAGQSSGRYRGLVKKGLVNGIECDLMYEMINQFIAYSTGAMSLADEAALRDAVGDWTTIYWKKFPPEIQNLVRMFLSGSLSLPEFDQELLEMLR